MPAKILNIPVGQLVEQPFSLNQVVKARCSYRPFIVAGNSYRVVEIRPGMSYTGWLVSVAEWKPGRIPKNLKIAETVDAGFFMRRHQTKPRAAKTPGSQGPDVRGAEITYSNEACPVPAMA